MQSAVLLSRDTIAQNHIAITFNDTSISLVKPAKKVEVSDILSIDAGTFSDGFSKLKVNKSLDGNFKEVFLTGFKKVLDKADQKGNIVDLNSICKTVVENIRKSQDGYNQYYHKGYKVYQRYSVGDHVMTTNVDVTPGVDKKTNSKV